MEDFYTEGEAEQTLLAHGKTLYARGRAGDEADLRRAERVFEHLAEHYGNAEAADYARKIDGLIISEGSETLQRARSALGSGDYREAALYYGDIGPGEPGYEESRRFFTDHAGDIDRAMAGTLAQARADLAAGRYEEAAEGYRMVLEADPNDAEAAGGLRLVTARRQEACQDAFQAAEQAREAGDFETARTRYTRSIELGCREDEARARLASMESAQSAARLYDELQAELGDRDYLAASETAAELRQTSPGYRDVEEIAARIDETITNLVETNYAEGKTHYAAKQYARALARFEIAARYDPDYKDLQEYISRCRAILETIEQSETATPAQSDLTH
jgi:tetratricopeptide (TPR) repeat protein